jgi:hypothetical protein
MPLILATWEAEIRRTADQAILGKKLVKLVGPCQPTSGCSGVWLSSHTIQEAEIRRITVPIQPGQKIFVRSHLKGKNLNVVLPACYPHYGRECKMGITREEGPEA